MQRPDDHAAVDVRVTKTKTPFLTPPPTSMITHEPHTDLWREGSETGNISPQPIDPTLTSVLQGGRSGEKGLEISPHLLYFLILRILLTILLQIIAGKPKQKTSLSPKCAPSKYLGPENILLFPFFK